MSQEEITQEIVNLIFMCRESLSDEEDAIKHWCEYHKVTNWKRHYRKTVSHINTMLQQKGFVVNVNEQYYFPA